MKRCPTCFRTYSDEALTFCLADGSLLSAPYNTEAGIHHSDSTPTEVMPRHPSAEGSQATLIARPGKPLARSLISHERSASDPRRQYFSEGKIPAAQQSEFLIEPDARIQRASLYTLMRVLVALTGAITAYVLYTTARRVQMSDDMYWTLRISQRVFIGLLLVTGQLALLRKYLKPMWVWALLTVMVVTISSIIDYFVIYFVGDFVFESQNELLKTTVWPILSSINAVLPWLLIGLTQWLVIQGRVRGAWLWMVAAIVATIISLFAGKAIDSLDFSPASIVSFILPAVCSGFIIGTAQALALLLFRKKRTPPPPQDDYA